MFAARPCMRHMAATSQCAPLQPLSHWQLPSPAHAPWPLHVVLASHPGSRQRGVSAKNPCGCGGTTVRCCAGTLNRDGGRRGDQAGIPVSGKVLVPAEVPLAARLGLRWNGEVVLDARRLTLQPFPLQKYVRSVTIRAQEQKNTARRLTCAPSLLYGASTGTKLSGGSTKSSTAQ
jgi:hypothetical protein